MPEVLALRQTQPTGMITKAFFLTKENHRISTKILRDHARNQPQRQRQPPKETPERDHARVSR